MKKLWVCVFLFFIPSIVWGTCSNCNTSTPSCSAGSTVTQINTCIDTAPDNAVITFANGNYTWGSKIDLNDMNGFTLICESVGGCNVTYSAQIFEINYVPSNSSNLRRISGFDFTGSASTIMLFYGANDLTGLRIDHNTFHQNSPSGCPHGIQLGTADSYSAGAIHGVIDNNTFTGATNWRPIVNHTHTGTFATGVQGTVNNMFIEDNTFNFTSLTDFGCAALDGQSDGVVVRYNNSTNGRFELHGVCHTGPVNFEVYNNTMISTGTYAGYREIQHQGTYEMIVFGNTVTGGRSDDIELMYYRSCDGDEIGCGGSATSTICDGGESIDGNRSPVGSYYGYPCYRQPGRNSSGTLRPVYAWNNHTSGGTKVDLYHERCARMENYHLKSNRDVYNAVSANAQTSPTSPFDGTTNGANPDYGMGFGTLANRPTTCSTALTDTADAGYGGVGYFATDVGAQGTLYRCSATNTWTAHYTPYTYPHPLRGETPSDTTAPSVTITTGNSTITTNSLTVTGTASDAGGVSSCKWRKGSAPDASDGTGCTGTTSWSCSTSGYSAGSNTLYVGCTDAAGNWGSDSITVTYTPPTSVGNSVGSGLSIH